MTPTKQAKIIEVMAKAICAEWHYSWAGNEEYDGQVAPEKDEVGDDRPSKALFRRGAKAALDAVIACGLDESDVSEVLWRGYAAIDDGLALSKMHLTDKPTLWMKGEKREVDENYWKFIAVKLVRA